MFLFQKRCQFVVVSSTRQYYNILFTNAITFAPKFRPARWSGGSTAKNHKQETTPKLLNDETDIYFYSFDDGVRDERLGMGAGDSRDSLLWYVLPRFL